MCNLDGWKGAPPGMANAELLLIKKNRKLREEEKKDGDDQGQTAFGVGFGGGAGGAGAGAAIIATSDAMDGGD